MRPSGCSGMCASTWDRRLYRHEHTFISGIVGCQSAALYRWETELVAGCRLGIMDWRRRRIGRPPRMSEVVMVAAGGDAWVRTPLDALWVAH